MNYRVYSDNGKGYVGECIVNNIDDLFIALDLLILEENNDKVLVIQHNIQENYDYPMYLFTGDILGYVDYKDNFYQNESRRLR